MQPRKWGSVCAALRAMMARSTVGFCRADSGRGWGSGSGLGGGGGGGGGSGGRLAPQPLNSSRRRRRRRGWGARGPAHAAMMGAGRPRGAAPAVRGGRCSAPGAAGGLRGGKEEEEVEVEEEEEQQRRPGAPKPGLCGQHGAPHLLRHGPPPAGCRARRRPRTAPHRTAPAAVPGALGRRRGGGEGGLAQVGSSHHLDGSG